MLVALFRLGVSNDTLFPFNFQLSLPLLQLKGFDVQLYREDTPTIVIEFLIEELNARNTFSAQSLFAAGVTFISKRNEHDVDHAIRVAELMMNKARCREHVDAENREGSQDTPTMVSSCLSDVES